MADKICVLTIYHRYGFNVYAAYSFDPLYKKLSNYCREWWDTVQRGEPIPESDEDLVCGYFDPDVNPLESYDILETEIIGG